MTSPDSAQALADAIRSYPAEFADAVVRRCVAEIPGYEGLPRDVLDGEVTANVAAVIELIGRAAAEGRPLTDQELALPIRWGSERARDGLSLEAVVATYPIGAREAWRLARTVAPELPAEAADAVFDFLAQILPPVSRAYLNEREDIDWETRERRQDLAATLLAGRRVPPSAHLGSPLADRYDVLVTDLAAPGDGAAAGAGAMSNADAKTRDTTNRLRSLRAALDSEPDVLPMLHGPTITLLLPVPDPAHHVERRHDIHRRLVDAAGHDIITASGGVVSRTAIPEAHNRAVELRDLASRLARQPGVYTLTDLALEYQISQPGPARAALAATLAPLAGRHHLLAALEALLQHRHDRAAAARALTIHRNTLTYRLRRIHTLTRLDPTNPVDVHTLAAALTAWTLTNVEASTDRSAAPALGPID